MRAINFEPKIGTNFRTIPPILKSASEIVSAGDYSPIFRVVCFTREKLTIIATTKVEKISAIAKIFGRTTDSAILRGHPHLILVKGWNFCAGVEKIRITFAN